MGTIITDDEVPIRTAITDHYGILDLPYGPMIINLHDTLLPINLTENQREIGELCTYARGVVLDIGANVGSHSINFARVADVVHAFEPQPRIFYNLCANLMLNLVYNVVPYNMALGSYCGETTVVALDPTLPGSPMGVPVGVGSQPTRIQTIDSLGISPIHFIKIDVEGHELEVLKGGIKTLLDENPIVYVEIHRAELIDQVRAYMHSLDYQDRKYIEVHTMVEGEDKILTVGYLFWREGRITWVVDGP
jgi:FkbM family methyltransferase